MSLAGSLEHVRAVDLVQFIYIGKRTGTLRIHAPTQEARIGFLRGHITNAALTGAPRLGELLVLAGLVPPTAITENLTTQAAEEPRRPLGQMLLAQSLVNEADIKQLLTEQFTRVVQEIIGWTVGEFEFVLDELWPIEDLGDASSLSAVHIELDTQGVLLDALSQQEPRSSVHDRAPLDDDEDPLAGFDPLGTPAAPATRPRRSSQTVPDALVLGAVGPDGQSGPVAAGPAFPRVQLVTRDAQLADRLGALLQVERARVTTVPARDAGFSLPGEPAPIVVLDLRGAGDDAEPVRALRRTRSKALVVAYCSPQMSQGPVYDAGAAALVHGDERALAASLLAVFRSRSEQASETLIREGLRAGYTRLRRIATELRSGVLETTVSLNLLSVLSESIERAVLFVVHEGELIPIGSFGVASSAKHFASMTQNMRLSLREPSAFAECAESDRARFARYDDNTLPLAFRQMVNAPQSGVFAVFPISGSQRVIAMIYADNGSKDHSMADVPLLDLALSQLGLALENELLRRARDAQKRALQPPTPPAAAGGVT
jgi:hypothetical protein